MFGDKRRPPATIAAEIDRIIGLNIRRAREDVRLGQHEVAAALGIATPILARYEDGLERAPASILLELARHVGCPLTDLFAGMPSMEAEDEFQGSRTAPYDPSPEPVATSPLHSFPDSRVSAAFATENASGRGDAAVVSSIIKAFSDLRNPMVRERLIGLLQALA